MSFSKKVGEAICFNVSKRFTEKALDTIKAINPYMMQRQASTESWVSHGPARPNR
jgi:hypothetical protein